MVRVRLTGRKTIFKNEIIEVRGREKLIGSYRKIIKKLYREKVDIILMQEYNQRIFEYAKKFGVDDFAAAFIRLEGDIILDFRIAWAMHIDTPGDTIILGTEGGLRIPSTDCWNGSIGGPLTIYQTIAGEKVETKIPMKTNAKDNFYNKIRSFLDAIKNNGTAPIPSSQIIKNQAIIDAIVKSAELGREVEVSIPEI